MLVLKMLEDRSLVVTKSTYTYQDENNAEVLKIILPKTFNDIDLKDCYIYLGFINQKNLGNLYDITSYLNDYSDNRYVVQIPMYQTFTYEPGVIEMWIKILHTPTEMVAKTNAISHYVEAHKDTEGVIPEQELSVVDALVKRMDTIEPELDNIDDRVEDVEAKTVNIDDRLDVINVKTDNIKNMVEDVNDKVDITSTEIDGLSDRVDSIVSGDEQITQKVIVGKVHEVIENE